MVRTTPYSTPGVTWLLYRSRVPSLHTPTSLSPLPPGSRWWDRHVTLLHLLGADRIAAENPPSAPSAVVKQTHVASAILAPRQEPKAMRPTNNHAFLLSSKAVVYCHSTHTYTLTEVSLRRCLGHYLKREVDQKYKHFWAKIAVSGKNKIRPKGIFVLLFILIAFHEPIGNECYMKCFLEFFSKEAQISMFLWEEKKHYAQTQWCW